MARYLYVLGCWLLEHVENFTQCDILLWQTFVQVLLPTNMTQEAVRVVAEYFGLTPLVEMLIPPPTPPSIQPRTHFPDILPLDVRGRWTNFVGYRLLEIFWSGRSTSIGHFWPATPIPTSLKCSLPILDIPQPGLPCKMQTRQYQSPGTGARYQILKNCLLPCQCHLAQVGWRKLQYRCRPWMFHGYHQLSPGRFILRDMTQYADLLQIHPNTVAFFSMIGWYCHQWGAQPLRTLALLPINWPWVQK